MTTVETEGIQGSAGGIAAGGDENRQGTPSAGGCSEIAVNEGRKGSVRLQPAPIPKNSPWRTVQAVSRSVSSSEDQKWPSAHETAAKLADDGSGSKNRPQAIFITGKEKWIPMKPTPVVGEGHGGKKSQRKKKNGAIVNGNGSGANKKKSGSGSGNGNGSVCYSNNGCNNVKVPQVQYRKSVDNQKRQVEGSKKADDVSDEPQQQLLDDSYPLPNVETQQEQLEQQVQQQEQLQQQYVQSVHRRQHAPGQQHQQTRRRYQTSRNQIPHDGQKSFVPRQVQNGNVSNQSYRRNYHHRTNNGNYRVRVYTPQIDPVLAINNIARQIEYYFSIDNLEKDTYLRSQLNKNGWVSFATIASFYRLIKLSWGGDLTLIMGALREIVANKTATVELARVSEATPDELVESKTYFHEYAIRAKDWEKWLPDEPKNWDASLEILDISALDQFRFVPLQVSIQPTHTADVPQTTISEHSTEQTKVVEEDTAVEPNQS
ncbi:Sro9p Ecym_1041 [Eremothecium cymbalariae DBVPG|uniref:HTH La-type RNA-binding domain-containing protein n=1 Tax=Eremothecium cymbalariae (strain CBS 270.75 / DBVPG 7215 / KCTC 17166 / NRRL Y-17582) TaxID=931890 RepID=G8JM39_ERECY|nr:hypothetical protein Ecym_1041 [Eremothecium cymbalariae DBVPG\